MSGIEKGKLLKRIFVIVLGVVILGGLAVFSVYDFLLYHTVIEIFTIVVAFAIFMIVFNSSKYIDNNYFVILGVGYFFVAVFDLLHTLSYKGLDIISSGSGDIATQFWIAGRYFQALILLIGPYFVQRKVRIRWVFVLCLLASVILIYSIFSGIFPVCYEQGEGLTTFKISSEIIIVFLLVLSGIYLHFKRDDFNKKVYFEILCAIFLTVISEISFTLYFDVYGLFNIIGHIFRVGAFYLFYKAIVEVSLREPYSLLFRELKEHEQMLMETGRTARVGGWSLDWATKKLVWSEEIYRIHEIESGYIPEYEEIINYYPEPSLSELKGALESAAAGDEPQELELEFVSAKGNELWVRVIIKRRVEKDGSITLYGTFQDITQEKNAEIDLIRINTLFTSRNNEMEKMMHFVSHDLRSPLVNIQGFSREVLLSVEQMEKIIDGKEEISGEEVSRIRDIINYEIKGDLGYIRSAVEKMESLLSGLLKVRRAGRREFEPELIDMNGEIESIIRSMNSQIRSSGAEVNVGELPVCYGDRSQVSQIFTNLLDNALKYLKPNRKGQISITGYCESNFCYYTVEDNGTGIDKSQHEKIFRIFNRAVNDCDVKGEGIGLTIVGEIVERCGGQILVESEPGEGTKFIVVLPAGPIP